jgi:hypothetical protein
MNVAETKKGGPKAALGGEENALREPLHLTLRNGSHK